MNNYKQVYDPKILDNVRGTRARTELAKKMGVTQMTIYTWQKDISRMKLVDYVKLLNIMEHGHPYK